MPRSTTRSRRLRTTKERLEARNKKGLKKYDEIDIERHLNELDDAGVIDATDDMAGDIDIGRLCDEVRGLRLRHANYADTLVSKSVAKRLSQYSDEIAKRRQRMRELCSAMEPEVEIEEPDAPKEQPKAGPVTAPADVGGMTIDES